MQFFSEFYFNLGVVTKIFWFTRTEELSCIISINCWIFNPRPVGRRNTCRV